MQIIFLSSICTKVDKCQFSIFIFLLIWIEWQFSNFQFYSSFKRIKLVYFCFFNKIPKLSRRHFPIFNFRNQSKGRFRGSWAPGSGTSTLDICWTQNIQIPYQSGNLPSLGLISRLRPSTAVSVQ